MEDESGRGEDRVEFHDYYKFRVSYITQKSLGIIVLFVTGLTDKFDNIRKELVKCKKEFVNLFEEILQHRFDAKTFEVFDPIVDSIHKNLRPKISLIGFSGVGKTTITKLIRAEEIPMKHIPTITGDIATVKIGKLHFHLWDFAGQEQFSYLWNNFIKGSDAALLITDSTLENVEKSKFFLELIKEESPHAHTAVIGNKQDLEGAIKPAQIESVLGLKAYSMVAKDPDNRDKMIQIIADILEMSAEVSPLLKPLLERDKLIEEATRALKSADFERAAFLFDKISYLCIELGDDSLGKEFYEKSDKIKNMLGQVGAPQPTPAFPQKTDRTEKSQDLKDSKISKEITTSKPTIPSEISKEHKPPSPAFSPSKRAEEQIIHSEQLEKSSENLPVQNKQDKHEVKKEKVSLELNPEDFMVKIRPKTLGVVPKDAKSKLKTSAFGHVKNMPSTEPNTIFTRKQTKGSLSKDDAKEEINLKSTTRPIELFKADSQAPLASKTTKSPEITKLNFQDAVSNSKTPSTAMERGQIDHAKKNLIELKLKKADLSKMALDYDMKELRGEITKEELEEKKEKIKEYEKKIDAQIKELEKLLAD